ncbi:MAG TPA: NnrS family protein [Casimicrobiaceae bacterium]|nr:NnrS family protein [Casimicrobiaceae bacterium]
MTDDVTIPAVFRLGFRPFYLAASVFAALSIVLWAAQYSGWLRAPLIGGPLAHAHEMLYGYTFAVVAGFLFTAVRNWSGRPTPRGGLLAGIVAIWVAARVLAFTPFSVATICANVAFLLAVAGGIAVPLVQSGNRRNYFFVAIVAAAAIAEALTQLGSIGALAFPAMRGLQIGFDLVILIITIVTGRVIPMFTNNAIPQAGARRLPILEKVSIAIVLLVLAADLAGLSGAPLAGVLAFAAAVHSTRLGLWRPWRTLHAPLVWSLDLAYVWLPIHFALRAAAELGRAPLSLAIHALTVGAIGGLTLAMMTRTARGHTGLPLRADGADVIAYVLVFGAALLRVFGPLVAPPLQIGWIAVSALLWASAFGLYFIAYWPRLTMPRRDGKPG